MSEPTTTAPFNFDRYESCSDGTSALAWLCIDCNVVTYSRRGHEAKHHAPVSEATERPAHISGDRPGTGCYLSGPGNRPDRSLICDPACPVTYPTPAPDSREVEGLAALLDLAAEWEGSADFLVERHQGFAEARGMRTAAAMLRELLASNVAFGGGGE